MVIPIAAFRKHTLNSVNIEATRLVKHRGLKGRVKPGHLERWSERDQNNLVLI